MAPAACSACTPPLRARWGSLLFVPVCMELITRAGKRPARGKASGEVFVAAADTCRFRRLPPDKLSGFRQPVPVYDIPERALGPAFSGSSSTPRHIRARLAAECASSGNAVNLFRPLAAEPYFHLQRACGDGLRRAENAAELRGLVHSLLFLWPWARHGC